MLKPFNLSELSLDKPDKCKGLFFRGSVNAFINSNNEYVYTERMRPLLRMSCKGCEKCGYLMDDLMDDLKESISCDLLPVIKNIEDKAIYKLNIVNASTDWETGITDDYDLEFIKQTTKDILP